ADWLALGTLGVCAFWLETVEVRLPGGSRFTPAPAAYLAAALVPAVGVRAAALLAVVDAVSRNAWRGRGALEALEERLPLLAAFAAAAGLRAADLGPLAVGLVAPACYLAGVLAMEKIVRSRLDAL